MFFDNECLSYVYNSLHVVFVSGRYTIVPDSAFSEKDKELMFSYCYPLEDTTKVLVQPLKDLDSSLLFGVDNDVYEFLVRSLINPQFIHSVSPMLQAWLKDSQMLYAKQLHAVIHDNIMDIICFERGEMLFLNSFNYDTDNDIAYYIIYVCKQLSFNQLEDNLYLYSDVAGKKSLMPMLKTYIEHAEFVTPKIKSYRAAADQEMYIDIATLTECGL